MFNKRFILEILVFTVLCIYIDFACIRLIGFCKVTVSVMSSRARYPPPGMEGGRGSYGGINPNPFHPRNPTQNDMTRGPAPGNMNHQTFHNPQQQQWLRRTQFPPPDLTVHEVEKVIQSEAVDSRLSFLFFQIRN